MREKFEKIKITLLFILMSASAVSFGIFLGKSIDIVMELDTKRFLIYTLLLGMSILGEVLFGMGAYSLVYKYSGRKVMEHKNLQFREDLYLKRNEEYDFSKYSTSIDMILEDYYISKWNIVRYTALFIFSIIGIMSIDITMLIVAFFACVMPLFIPKIFDKELKLATEKYTGKAKEYFDFIKDKLNGRLEILKYGSEENIVEKHNEENKSLENTRGDLKYKRIKSNLVIGGSGFLSFLIMIGVGGLLIINGKMSIGGLLGVVQLMNYMVNPIINIANAKNLINSSEKLLEKYPKKILENVENKISESKVFKDKIEIKNLNFKYEEKNILNNIDLEIEKGNKYLIKGESGTGKSTLAKLLSRELSPSSGSIKIDGIKIEEIDENNLNHMIKYVDQDTYLFEDSIRYNIDLDRNIQENKIKDILSKLSYDVNNLEREINNKSGVSGGQKSRICLARATCDIPEILIVDEPTAALDKETTDKVFNYLLSLPLTLIVITHEEKECIKGKFNKIIDLNKVA